MNEASEAPTEAWQRRRLHRMQAVAGGLLALMALTFAITFRLGTDASWVGYLRAFTEAAMVGALADWFAVTALFRHPLGIPIPHTAIIPQRKDQLGEALARFVRENFLSTETLSARLAHIDFADAGATWMAKPKNAARVGREAARILDRVLEALDDDELRDLLQTNLNVGLRRLRIAPLLGEGLQMLLRSDRERELMDAGIGLAYDYLHENKASIHRRIVEETPWWLPNIVDREIYRRLVTELERFLLRVRHDPNDPDRTRFNRGIRDLVVRLQEDPELNATAERIKRNLIDDPAVQDFLSNLLTQIRVYVRRETERPNSRLARRIAEALATLAGTLREREDTRREINEWLGEAVLHTVSHFRGDMARVISETVREWDAELTAERVELYVGRDLQFIRINGTLIGGLVGLTIHLVTQLLGLH
ncbi:MAG: DUF445 domain-containing protein [Pseudomonadota bacterium]